MVFARSSVLLIAATSALAFQANADPCDGDNYSKVAAAAENIHTNCASYHAYLANGGTWTCDSKCHDAVSNLVNTLPDCTFGGPYGQNYKQVVENMVATCGGQVSTDSTTAPSSTTAAPTTESNTETTTTAPTTDNNSTETAATTQTTDAPTAGTDAPTTTDDKNGKQDTIDTSSSTSASAGDSGTPASDVSTTSGANTKTVTSITALVLVVAGALLH
ncbi:hypothetical protein PHMEG_00026027 [Phytophthora megakarya]|uniref:Elicitin n=1 Tax=Phytophthora megakarya TaxID=4795 RepID=A0A225V9K4_9STRA|nr:hypothetical protein PHMEG_00026027 [Phytophthora megakarya]